MLVALVLLSAATGVVSAQSLEEIQRREQAEAAVRKLDELTAQMDEMTRTRELDCLKAFGRKPFCHCINEKLPVVLSFSEYVSITTRSKEANGYEKLSPDLREAYDRVTSIRNHCVESDAL
jgi:hypothetical protein